MLSCDIGNWVYCRILAEKRYYVNIWLNPREKLILVPSYDTFPAVVQNMLKTVEVPFSGHPDKICDQIVDTILDEYLKRDPKSRVDIQALGSHGMVMIGGTVDSKADFDVAAIASQVYADIGFQDDLEPFVNIERPSEEMARTIVKGGAQGTAVVYGYATKQTREFLPKPVVYANALARRVEDLRRHDERFSFLQPDGKVQIAMDGERVVSVSLLVQYLPMVELNDVKMSIVEQVIAPVIGDTDGVKLFVNSAGEFLSGGFSATGGASGRKELSDTYGGLLPHGGALFTGKDPLQPARCGSYMARYVAKNLVAEGVAGNVFVTAGYTIGSGDPIFVQATSGTGQDLSKLVRERYDFRPEAIVERLQLQQPLYRSISTYGQFGREGMPWEEIHKA